MATFTLSGSGTHAITAGTGALHVHVTTLPTIRGAGRAEPTNYYDLGLLRLGDGTYWWPSIPIDAEFQLLGCPQGTLEIAYALFNGTELSVVEVAGANPLAGSRTLEDLSDVLIAAVSDGQVLAWNASAGKWENVTPSGGGGGTLTTAQAYMAADTTCASGVWVSLVTVSLGAGTWLVWGHATIANAGGAQTWQAKISDGTTDHGGIQTVSGAAGWHSSIQVESKPIVLTGTTTIGLYIRGDLGGTVLHTATLFGGGTLNQLTGLTALQVA